MTMAEHLLEIINLVKTFQSKSIIPGLRPKYEVLPSVDNVSFFLEKGEILGLIGESGSGKTTLGKCIIKLANTTSGQINLFGSDVTQLSERQFRPFRKDIQMIFQDLDAALNPNMRIYKILEEIIYRQKKSNQSLLNEKIDQLLSEVNLDKSILQKYPTELSGGQKRRIAIAAVLAIQPKIIIADEPSTGLDSYTQTVVMELIKDLQKRRDLSVLFISHDLQLVKQSCQRIIVLYLGDIVEIGLTSQISTFQAHPYTKLLWNSHLINNQGPKPEAKKVSQNHNIRSGLHDFARPMYGCRFAPRCERFKEMNMPDICTNKATKPVLKTLKEGHQVACHFDLSHDKKIPNQ